jgi:hypothetical protein
MQIASYPTLVVKGEKTFSVVPWGDLNNVRSGVKRHEVKYDPRVTCTVVLVGDGETGHNHVITHTNNGQLVEVSLAQLDHSSINVRENGVAEICPQCRLQFIPGIRQPRISMWPN